MSSGQNNSVRPDPEADDRARYWVRVGSKELPLEGETVIGRGDGCQIIVNDDLVSRRHARILLDGGRPYVEDLGSANGTFVNQARLHGKALLFPGDHVFVGTCEVELVRREDDDRPTLPLIGEDDPDQHTPASGVGTFRPVQPGQGPASERKVRSSGQTVRPMETTTEVDGIEYLGRLADKMFTMGRIDAAIRILSSQIDDVLRASRGGKTPPPNVIDTVGRYALKLAHETLDARWVDMAVELHTIACRPFREETIQQLSALRAKAPLGDDGLFGRYHDKLRSQLSEMPPSERNLCERIACLLPVPGTGR